MVLNENANYDFNLLSKQDRTQLVYSTELTTERVSENFGRDCPVAVPLIIGVRGGGAAAPPGLENFRANSVFRATASSSKVLNNKIYFSTVKNSRATCFSGQAQVTQNSRIIKNIFNTAKICRASASCSKILNNKKHIQYSEFRAPSVFQGKRKLLKNPE